MNRWGRNFVLLFCIYLILTVLTRLHLGFLNAEKIFFLPQFGIDLFYGAIKPAVLMLQGQEFISVYGPSFTLVYALLLKTIIPWGVCNESFCMNILYPLTLSIVVAGYFLLIFLLTKKDATNRIILFLIFTTFLLGIPGSLGLATGNTDIFLSLVFGFTLHSIFGSLKLKKSGISTVLVQSFLLGMIANAKLYLLPLCFIALFAIRRTALAITIFAVTYIGVSYVPRMSGAPSNILDPVRSYLIKNSESNYLAATNIEYNNSVIAISTLFTQCLAHQECNNPLSKDKPIITFISRILLFIVFVLPFVTSRAFFRLSVARMRFNPRFILLLFILGTAAVNLIPNPSFAYRLYFSLPVLFLVWIYGQENKSARWYCFLSISFLFARGLWIFTQLDMARVNLLEPRGMNMLILAHYYFLIKSGISLMMNRS